MGENPYNVRYRLLRIFVLYTEKCLSPVSYFRCCSLVEMSRPLFLASMKHGYHHDMISDTLRKHETLSDVYEMQIIEKINTYTQIYVLCGLAKTKVYSSNRNIPNSYMHTNFVICHIFAVVQVRHISRDVNIALKISRTQQDNMTRIK